MGSSALAGEMSAVSPQKPSTWPSDKASLNRWMTITEMDILGGRWLAEALHMYAPTISNLTLVG